MLFIQERTATIMSKSSFAHATSPVANGRRTSIKADVVKTMAAGYWPIILYPMGYVVEEGGKPQDGKRPIGNGWGLKRTTLEQANARLRSFPDANLGIGLGPERGPDKTWLIDIEVDGPQGEESFIDLTGGEDPKTPSWSSPRGKHRLFVADEIFLSLLQNAGATEGKGMSAGVFHLPQFPDLEFRVGGLKENGEPKQLQSVIPPSVTRTKEGQELGREWIHGIDVPLSEVPFFAFDVLAELESRRQEAPQPEPVEPPTIKFTAGAKGGPDNLARASAYLAKVDPAISGQRGHDKAFRAACLIGPGFDLTPSEATHLLRNEYNPRCEPPWSDRELMHKVEDAYKVEARRGWLLDAPPKNGRAHHGTNGHAEANGHHEENGENDGRPAIEITTEEHKVVDQAIEALRRETNLYQRAKSLVSVIDEVKPEKKKRGITRPTGAPQIVPLPTAQVRRLMSVHADWWKRKRTRSGDEVAVDANVPGWSVEMVATMKTWNGIRPLEGITEIPTFRPDGSLITKPGYDEDTGLFYCPSIEFPKIPENPSELQIETSVRGLKHLVSDFPFAGSWAAWLAAMLTPMARFAIDGPCPLFLIDANVAGAGKTKLVDLIALALTGRPAARGTYSEDDEEMRKVITSITLAGDRIVLFDNIEVGGHIGGPSLDRYLTAGTWNDRILGRSEMTGDMDAIAVLYATGNNIGLKGDALRRISPITLKSLEERPEERKGFAIEGDLLKHFKENRAGYVAMALTILRGYIAAGRPTFDLTPMDYEAWCGLIRNAVKWATDEDPCEGRYELIKNDDVTNRNKALVKEWKALCELANMSALSAGQAIAKINEYPKETEALRSILMQWSRDDKLPLPQRLGNELGKIKGKNYGGLELCKSKVVGDNTWYAKTVSTA